MLLAVKWLAWLLLQTQVTPDQIRNTVTVVEWQKCSSAACDGMWAMRYRYADGSVSGYYIVVPAPPEFVPDSKWSPTPIR